MLFHRDYWRSLNAMIVLFVILIQYVNGGVVSWGRNPIRRPRCKNPPCYTEPKPPVSNLI